MNVRQSIFCRFILPPKEVTGPNCAVVGGEGGDKKHLNMNNYVELKAAFKRKGMRRRDEKGKRENYTGKNK